MKKESQTSNIRSEKARMCRLLCLWICLSLALPAQTPPLEELKSEARALVDQRKTFTQQMVDVTAALVWKQIMAKYEIPGTIGVYPGIGEEVLARRAYMVQAGLFRDLDVMLSSHISNEFSTTYGPSGSGLVSTEYSFHGQ